MFTTPTIPGPAGPTTPDGLAAFGPLARLQSDAAASFGRVARSYPSMPRGRARLLPAMPPVAPALPAPPLRRGGPAATVRLLAGALARLARAAQRCGQQWARQRERRLTEQALSQLPGHTLRDIGLAHGEIGSIAAEVSGRIEATRARAWLEIGSRIV